jgi:hypothetical protein
MHGRTRKTLLALGFDTDLIAKIDRLHQGEKSGVKKSGVRSIC